MTNLLRLVAGFLALIVLTSAASAQIAPGGPAPRGEDSRPAPTVRAEVATFNGRPEYVVIAPPGQANAATSVLTAQGAQLLRSRQMPGLGLTTLVFDLRRARSLTQAQQLLAQAAPGAEIDSNALYRFAQGAPRLYAATLIGDASPCRVGGLKVGMIDGPVNLSHPALIRATVTIHDTLLDNDRAPNPAHGTAVAALIAGEDPGGALAGYAAGVQLHAVSAFAAERGGEAADVDRIGAALDVLQRNNVRLVNMSFAGPKNRALTRVLTAAAGKGMAMLAAAGNDASSRAAWPAGADPVIAVTAVDAASRKYRRANTGAHIAFAAPGVDLYVASATGGKYASGTSYAAPIATALAARLMARGTSAANLATALQRRTTDLGPPGRDSAFGWGLLRASGC